MAVQYPDEDGEGQEEERPEQQAIEQRHLSLRSRLELTRACAAGARIIRRSTPVLLICSFCDVWLQTHVLLVAQCDLVCIRSEVDLPLLTDSKLPSLLKCFAHSSGTFPHPRHLARRRSSRLTRKIPGFFDFEIFGCAIFLRPRPEMPPKRRPVADVAKARRRRTFVPSCASLTASQDDDEAQKKAKTDATAAAPAAAAAAPAPVAAAPAAYVR